MSLTTDRPPNTKPFFFDKCVKGTRLVTRDGREAMFVQYERNDCFTYYPVVVAIEGKECFRAPNGREDLYSDGNGDVFIPTEDYKLMNHEHLEVEVGKLMEKYRITYREFTEKQLAECIQQALESGEFVKQCSRNAQQIVYLPHRQVFELRNRVRKLEQLLEENKIEIPL